jgi:hypothetical protein
VAKEEPHVSVDGLLDRQFWIQCWESEKKEESAHMEESAEMKESMQEE